MDLSKNLETFLFWASDDDQLHKAKQEVLKQILQLEILIGAKGFFEIDRKFLAGVSLDFWKFWDAAICH